MHQHGVRNRKHKHNTDGGRQQPAKQQACARGEGNHTKGTTGYNMPLDGAVVCGLVREVISLDGAVVCGLVREVVSLRVSELEPSVFVVAPRQRGVVEGRIVNGGGVTHSLLALPW